MLLFFFFIIIFFDSWSILARLNKILDILTKTENSCHFLLYFFEFEDFSLNLIKIFLYLLRIKITLEYRCRWIILSKKKKKFFPMQISTVHPLTLRIYPMSYHGVILTSNVERIIRNRYRIFPVSIPREGVWHVNSDLYCNFVTCYL